MELRFVVPNMEKTFGNLEFAGEDKTEQRRINGRTGGTLPKLQPLFRRTEGG